MTALAGLVALLAGLAGVLLGVSASGDEAVHLAAAHAAWADGLAGLKALEQSEPRAIGFGLLAAPAHGLGGDLGVRLLVAAAGAAGLALAVPLGRRLVPDPWPGRAALVGAVSAPAVLGLATAAPGAIGGTLVAAAALLALRVRERPGDVRAVGGCALTLGLLPWLGTAFLPVSLVLGVVLLRWLRRRRRGLAGFVALEVVLTLAVVWLTVHEELFGVLPALEPIGPRRAVLALAPFLLLALRSLALLARAARQRLEVAVPGLVDAEVTGALYGVVTVVCVLSGVPAAGLPCAIALCSWALRRHPRAGAGLAVLTVAATGASPFG